MIRFARAWTSPKIDLVLSLVYRDRSGVSDYQNTALRIVSLGRPHQQLPKLFRWGFFLPYIWGMKATLTRQQHAKYTRGKLTVDNGFTCDTLELPWLNNAPRLSCIPIGTYKVVPRRSDKYGQHLHVSNVQGRDLILIHWGNYAASVNPLSGYPDIKGCILVGYGYADLDGDGLPEIVRSKDAFKALMASSGLGFTLTIE